MPMAHLKYPVPVLPDSAKHKFGCWSDLTVHCHIYNFERYCLAFIKGLHLLILSLLGQLGNILLWRFDQEIFSTIILSLPLIQEGQMSVSGERMCTLLVNRLED